ncbi:MAG: DUF2157 domain-containing protein [Kiloniellales bacterium]|nr:DUF2157 domain-containing protein [Kiloniellales bacterium]
MQRQAATPSGSEWRAWTGRVLLFLGAAQIIAGIFFFFAYNWDDLARWQKLGATQTGIVICALAARFAGLESPAGKVLLLGAGALVGVALAVYGQIYQTGADTFDLFAAWAGLILGWVLIARFAAFWIFWAVIVNVALAFYLDTFTEVDEAGQLLLFGLLNAGFLLSHEVARQRFQWLAHPWSRRVLMAACLLLLAVAVATVVVELRAERWLVRSVGPLSYLAVPAYLAVALSAYLWSSGKGRDLIGLFLVVLSACGVAWYAGMEVADELFDDEGVLFLVMAGLTLAIFGPAGLWLHRTWLRLEATKGAGRGASHV